MSEPSLGLPPRKKQRRHGALGGQIGGSFEPLLPAPAEAPAPAPMPAPSEAVQQEAEPVIPAEPVVTAEMQRQAYQQQFVNSQQAQPTPAKPKKPRKARPVTTGKFAVNLPLTTIERLDNTFGHLYLTGQIDRKSHLVNQAIIELCERLESDQNDGEMFPESTLRTSPTGAPRKPSPEER